MQRYRTLSLPLLVVQVCLFLIRFPLSSSWVPKRRQAAAFATSTTRTSSSTKTRTNTRPTIHLPTLPMAFVDGWFPFQMNPTIGSGTAADKSQAVPRIVIVIPAYNEEDRILSTLETYRDFLRESNWTSEILVVDDGSTDKTVDVVHSFLACTTSSSQEDHEDDAKVIPVQCLSMPTNQGKGAALAAGIKHIAEKCAERNSNSTLILTQDADGSGDLAYLECMIDRMKALLTVPVEAEESDEEEVEQEVSSEPATTIDWTKPAIVTGNRNYNPFSPRGITRWGFQTAVRLIMNDLRVQDSQCGYKLMTLAAARDLYDDLEVSGWAHDVEVLYRAKLVDMPIEEVLIDWNDKEGSKVVESGVARVSIQMLLDVIKLRWEYSNFRAWLSLGDF